jgi:outer membrane protein TolC
MKGFIKGNYIFTVLLAAILPVMGMAQQGVNTLSVDEVTSIVRQYHPVAKQAVVGVDMAAADITIAKGGFDPLLQVNNNRKTFDGINYYNHGERALKIPTWYGIELQAGTESLGGNRTDPQETAGRTSYAGISVPLLKNLLMDKRRAALQQSKLLSSMSKVEQQSILNNLQYEAITAYWKWVQYHQVYSILKNAVVVNERRFALVKNAYKLGERPAIDTTEALTQLQQFQYLQNEALLDFQNAGVEFSAYLWQQNNQAYNLPQGIVPDTAWQKTMPVAMVETEEALLEMAARNHPDLRQYNYKLAVLKVEKKLKFQELLPVMNLKYNQLGKGYNLAKTIATPVFENNFRFGVSFAVPLRLSQGRGEYRKAKLKIQDTEYELQYKQLQVQNKVKMYRNEVITLLQQVQLQQNALVNYQVLVRGEETRFFNGESSLFLINARETKMLEAMQKLAEVKVKLLKTAAGLRWAAGLLN